MYVNNDINYIKFLKDKTAYIFGAGVRGSLCLQQMRNNDIKVAAFIDNSKALQGTMKDDLEIISLSDYENKFQKNNNSMIVISVARGEAAIKEQLMTKNIYNFVSASQIDFGVNIGGGGITMPLISTGKKERANLARA